jgi:hypothetical protein
MIDDKATERLKDRARKLGLIINAAADKPKPKPKASGTDGKVSVKLNKKGSKK